MTLDPAELLAFRSYSSEAVFQEAARLGLSPEALEEEPLRRRVAEHCLLRLRTETVRQVAAGLGIEVTRAQAEAIARNSLVAMGGATPAPLDPAQRQIAEELYFHALKAAAARHQQPITDWAARAGARRLLRKGEQGGSRWRHFATVKRCLILLILLVSTAILATLAWACISIPR